MRLKAKRIFIKRMYFWLLLSLALLMMVQSVVMAAYIGPQRTRTVTTYLRVCWDTHISPWPETCRCNPGGPGQRCGEPGSADYHCYEGEDGNDSCQEQTSSNTITDPPATVSGSPVCSLNGNSGWCRGQVTVNFSANEPVAGKVITFIEGTPGTLCDPADAASVSCNRVDSTQGNTSYDFWAHTTYGDTSAMGTASYKIDSINPTLAKTVPAANGSNGWFVTTPVTVSVSGTDGGSGLSSAQVQVDGGGWANGSASISSDGTHALNFRTVDVAGNTNTSSDTVKIDKTKPTITLNLSGTSGLAGWYVSDVALSPNASDATSGLASSQVRVDGGAWAASQSITAEGSHTAEGQAADNAGNTNTATSTVKIDKTNPLLIPSIPAPDGANGWHITTFLVDVSAVDAISGVSYVQKQLDGGVWRSGGFEDLEVAADGTHTLNFRAQDVAGNNAAQSQSAKLDTVNPTSGISLSGTSGLAGWYVSNVTANPTGTDATSGIASREVQVDGGAWATGATITTDGTHAINARSLDNAGLSATSSASVKIDKTLPTISGTIPAADGLNGWNVSPAALSASGTDATSGLWDVAISLDGGAWQGSPYTVATEGNHAVIFRSRDNAGNTNTTNGTLKLDLVAPVITPSAICTFGLNSWCIAPATLSASGTDAVSGIDASSAECNYDSLGWASSPVTLGTDGNHTAICRISDLAGHTTTSPNMNIKVDQTDPTLTYNIPAPDGANGWRVSATTVTVSGTDATSGMMDASVQLDGGAWTPNSLLVNAEGNHSVDLRTRDNAGNENTAAGTLKLDLTDPTSSITRTGTTGANGWYVSAVTANPEGTDAVSGVDKLEIKTASSAWQSSLNLTDGIYNLTARTTDLAGRTTTSPVLETKVDATAPTLIPGTPAPDGLNGWHVTPFDVAAGGSDATSGVAAIEVQLDGGAWANPVNVSTDGTHALNFRVTDNAGNVTLLSNQPVKLDATAPTLVVDESGTAGAWYISPATVTATGTDATSGLDRTEMNLDGAAWQNTGTMTLSTDGVYSVDARAYDLAGNVTNAPAKTIQVDQTPPVLGMRAAGTTGDNGWWVTPLTVFSVAYDATSGIKTVDGKLDAGAWAAATSVNVTANGESTVYFRAEDVAGHTSYANEVYKVDAVKPLVSITAPAANEKLAGIVTVTGTAGDAHSGLRMAEISLNGSTWEGLSVSAGAWSYTWDTRARGSNNILVRTTDVAGNTNIASVPVIVANAGPSISLTELWYIWQTGELVVRAGDSELARVTVVISDVESRWPAVTLSYSGDLIPETVKWDRKFANGVVAPPGRYLASAEAVDVNGKSASAVGWIVIPQPAQPTATPTAVLPTATATAQPTATAIATGTPEPTGIPAIVVTPKAPPVEPKPIEVPPQMASFALWLFLLAGIAMSLILSTTAVTDRRPQEINKITEMIRRN